MFQRGDRSRIIKSATLPGHICHEKLQGIIVFFFKLTMCLSISGFSHFLILISGRFNGPRFVTSPRHICPRKLQGTVVFTQGLKIQWDGFIFKIHWLGNPWHCSIGKFLRNFSVKGYRRTEPGSSYFKFYYWR